MDPALLLIPKGNNDIERSVTGCLQPDFPTGDYHPVGSLWLASRYDTWGGHHILPCTGWGGAQCGRTWLGAEEVCGCFMWLRLD